MPHTSTVPLQPLSPKMTSCLSYDSPGAASPRRKRTKRVTEVPWQNYVNKWRSLPTQPQVGAFLEVLDGSQWYVGTIKAVKQKRPEETPKVIVHFWGWSSRTDRWVE